MIPKAVINCGTHRIIFKTLLCSPWVQGFAIHALFSENDEVCRTHTSVNMQQSNLGTCNSHDLHTTALIILLSIPFWHLKYQFFYTFGINTQSTFRGLIFQALLKTVNMRINFHNGSIGTECRSINNKFLNASVRETFYNTFCDNN